MWLHYLGEDYDRANTSAYAAPARAQSLAGNLPRLSRPTASTCCATKASSTRSGLLAEGIPVELYNVPGAYHGAPLVGEPARD